MKHNSSFRSKLMRSMIIRCFIAAVSAAIILAVVFFLTRLIAHLFTWYTSPLYQFLNIIENNSLLIIIGIWLVALYFIIYHYWSKSVSYIEEIVEASKVLIVPEDVSIHLSPLLSGVEDRMNQIKHTALKNERAVREEVQRKNDLIVYLAHDIKTPLTSVIGYLSLLDETPDMPSGQKAKYVGITLEKAYRLDQLVDEFFEITRFNLQHIEISRTRINLSLMLGQLVDEFYPMLAAGGKTAVLNVSENLILWGDADKLSRVFNNILKNAVAYSYDHCTIQINAFQQGQNSVVTFTNQGDTIPGEKLNRIFEKFYRLDSARSSYTGGAGLGLAIAKEIVNAHGGTISVQSEENKTVFTVTIPHADSQGTSF